MPPSTPDERPHLSPDAVTLREIGPAYAGRMRGIVQAAPMPARDLTLCVDRHPSLFRMTELHFERYHYAGFFLDDELIGFTVFGVKTLYVGGRPEPVFTQTDFYLHPRLQGRGLGRALWFRSFSFFAERGVPGCRIGYNVIMKGNRRAEQSIGLQNPEPPYLPYSRKIADFEIRTLMTTFPRRERGPYRVRAAARSDVPAVVRLLDDDFRTRLFGPVLTEASFDRMLRERPGFDLDRVLTAWSGSELVGVCAFWDPSAYKQSVVVRYGPRFRAVAAGYTLAGRVFGFPALPQPGERFRELDVAEYAVRERDPAILGALLARGYNLARRDRYHLVAFGSSRDDPLLRAARGLTTQAVGSTVTLVCLDAESLDRAARGARLPFVNVALL